MPAAQPPQPPTTNTKVEINVVRLYNQLCLGCGLQECRRSFWQESSIPSHTKRRRWQTAVVRNFQNKLVDVRRRSLHFEQVQSRYVARRQSYERGEKSVDRRTDRQLFIFI